MTDASVSTTADPSPFLAGLCAEVWLEDEAVHARMDVQPSHLRPGTERLRVGILATMVDVIGGAPAWGILNPTVDLRVTLGDRAPSSGAIEFVCRPLRVGKRLFVSETIAHAGDPAAPFMRAISTFVNRVTDHTHADLLPDGTPDFENYDELLEIREPTPGVYEIDNHPTIGNSHSGTMIGGAQAILAEMVAEREAERLYGQEHEAFDLDIRYLDTLRTVDVRARAETLPGGFDHRCFRVAMVEADDDERLVSMTTVLCHPVP
jgi:acyl-coenzyme A thioesterase PaaI-like protein